MSFVTDYNQEHITESVDAFKRACILSTDVNKVFKHKAITTSHVMIEYADYLYRFMHNTDLPPLTQYKELLGHITYQEVTDVIVEYSKCKSPMDINAFMYNPVTNRSVFLQTFASILNNTTTDDVANLLGKRVFQRVIQIQDKWKVPMLDKIKKLVVWYSNNRKRIELGNPATFGISPLKSVKEFINSLTDRATEDYSVYHVNSPQWFIWSEWIEEVYHVDIYTTADYGISIIPEYKVEDIRPADILKRRF